MTSPARLAAAVMYLRDDELMAAAGQLSSLPQDSRDPAVVYARFYLSWRQGDGASCVVQLARSDESNLYLGTRHRQAVIAARVFLLIEALKSERFDDALTLLEVGPDQDASRLLATIRNLVPWLMRNGMAPAARKLLAGIRQRIPQQGAEDERYALDWACLAFEPLLTAQLGQYTACVESADRVIRLALPRHPAFGTAQADTQILAWCNLLRIAAELGLAAATSADEIKLLWLSLRRTLEDRTVELSTIEPVRPYALLISGLVAGLSTDMVVDQSTLHGLSSAQRELDLSRHATFLERVIAKSHSRLRAIADFWEALRRGNLNRAREIHRKELVPTFGERVPHAIKLASLVADWGADALTPQELTLRLDQLQYDAPELPAGVVADFRSHIADGEKIREITRLLREQRFDEVVTIINNATWAGIEANAMPVAVAVAKLYALFKTRNVEASTDLASGLSDARGLADWVRDAGALLLGYVWFERREFPQAAAAFQRMSRPTLLGHNMEAYLAAAHFNEGLQLLEVDNKEKAFDAFARSLSVTSRAEKTASLLPLFLHFGLKGLEANSAPRARKAFQLAMRSVAEEGSSAQTSFRGLIAQLGDLLRKALDSEEVDPPDGSDFLDLLEDLGELPSPENISPQVFERTVRILAICQDLRRQAALPTGKRIAEPKLTSFLRTQIAALEKLAPEPKHHDRVVGLAPEPEQRDPVVGVLKGVVDLLMGRNRRNRMAVLDELEAAFRLGVQSQKLADLVRKERDQIKTLLADKTNGLDLLDVYLASGEAPPALVDDWTADAALTELYRLDRGYMPADVSGESKESEFASLLARLNALAEYAEEKFPKLGKDLKETISEVETGGKRLRDLEQKIACELAASLREQRQDGATPAGTS